MSTYECLNLSLLFLTFGAVFWYATETRLMRKAMNRQIATMVDQLEAPDRPYLSVPLGFSGVGGGNLALYNEGNGTAFSVRVRAFDSRGKSTAERNYPSVSPRAWLPIGSVNDLDPEYALIVCSFKSINGRRYETRQRIFGQTNVGPPTFRILPDGDDSGSGAEPSPAETGR